MNTVNLILAVVLLIPLAAPSRALQKGGREKMPPREPTDNSPNADPKVGNTTRRSNGSGRTKPPKPKPTSALSIRVTPSDSTIYLQGEEYRAENGLCNIVGLPAGKYNLNVRRDGYHDDGGEITLNPGVETSLQFSLVPFNGTLHVAPLVADTEIHVVESATSKSVGVYFGQVRYIEFPPGRYQILISKEGYQTLVREVVIEPAAKISLEPSLAPLPKPVTTTRRAAPPFPRDTATRVQSNSEGKFIVVVLYGRSGDTLGALGAIDVTLRVGDGQAYVTSISGMFTGYPCQVDFVRLENVAEYSFVEPPGAANQWARAVIRIRPKESKRPVHFLINWKSLRDTVPNGPSIN
jgi:hypothetical protein